MSVVASRVDDYIRAVKNHRGAKLRWSQEFLLAYSSDANSFYATQVANDRTGAEVIETEAIMKLAEKMLDEDY